MGLSNSRELCSSNEPVHPKLNNELGKLISSCKRVVDVTGHQDSHDLIVHYYNVHMTNTDSHHWNYLNKGQDWGCPGSEQSPICVETKDAVVSSAQFFKIWWKTQPIQTKVVDNGHTLMVEGAFSRCVGVNDFRISEVFEAIQLHFHTPSEHLVDGKEYPLEMHIVHNLIADHFDEGVVRNVAVIGVFFEIDEKKGDNLFINSLKLDSIGTPIVIVPHELLGDLHRPEFYAYKGSLTTPPCSELVNWFVLKKPLTITKKQLELFSQRLVHSKHGNRRETQPLNGRTVFRGNCDREVMLHDCFA